MSITTASASSERSCCIHQQQQQLQQQSPAGFVPHTIGGGGSGMLLEYNNHNYDDTTMSSYYYPMNRRHGNSNTININTCSSSHGGTTTDTAPFTYIHLPNRNLDQYYQNTNTNNNNSNNSNNNNNGNNTYLHPGGGSSGANTTISDISNTTRIVAAMYGNSPPEQLPLEDEEEEEGNDILLFDQKQQQQHQSLSQSLQQQPSRTPAANTGKSITPAVHISSYSSISATTTTVATPFRLEPKFGITTTTTSSSSSCNVLLHNKKSSPHTGSCIHQHLGCTTSTGYNINTNPRPSSSSNNATRGRKRSAQSIALNNSFSWNSSNSSGTASFSTIVSSRGGGGRGTISQQQEQRSMMPPSTSPRKVDATLFHLQGLSIRSPQQQQQQQQHRAVPNGTIAASIPALAAATSPATTHHSAFTVGCGTTSSFSKVNTSFNTPSVGGGGGGNTMIDCGTPVSSFRNYRSNSFGSTIDHRYDKQCDSVVGGANIDMIPPSSLSQANGTIPIDVRMSSPRTVPLTVLTHDCVPTALSSLSPVGRHYRQASMGSGASFTGTTRPPTTQQQQTIDNSLLLSVNSSSSNSEECMSSSGTLPTVTTIEKNSKNQLFREDHHRTMIRTPQRYARPPLSTVQCCPDSKHSTMSILHDSPFGASGDVTIPESPITRLPLPKVSLTPRSSRNSNSISMGLPKFPSPKVDEDRQEIGTTLGVWPVADGAGTCNLNQGEPPLVPPHVRRLSEINLENNDSKEDLTLKDGPIEDKVNNKGVRKTFFPRWSNFSPQTNVKSSDGTADTTTPKDATLSSKVYHTDLMNKTMSSTPSGCGTSTRTPLKDVIIEFGNNINNGINPNLPDYNTTADVESLSDGEDDEFFLAIPSTLEDEKRNKLDAEIRQTKQPRLFNCGYPSSDGIKSQARVTSMSSFGSTNSLLGAGFALSSTSLRGMDTSSNSNLCGMIPSNLNGRHRSSLNFSVGTSTCINGMGMHRVHSTASIGLDLDHVVQTTTGMSYDGCATAVNNHQVACRDLTTPPMMQQASQPPPLSPRFGSMKNDVQ